MKGCCLRLLFILLLAGEVWAQITVAPGGWGDYESIQAAVDAANPTVSQPVVIYIYPGVYQERVTIPVSKSYLTLVGVGSDRAEVVLTEGAGDPVLTAAAHDLLVQDMTIENTAGATAGQQQAMYINGQRQIFENVCIKGWQDTLAIWNGCVSYFHKCDIWGSVDFIYSGGTAVFDHCDITQRRDTGGPVTAPSTPQNVAYGFVFLDCHITKTAEVKTNSSTLMRPWRDYGMTAYLRCTMDNHITAKGWSEWGGREATCRAIEYDSLQPNGQTLSLSQRAAWVDILTDTEAAEYTVAHILGSWDPNDRPIVGVPPALIRSDIETLLQEHPGGAAGLGQGTWGGAGRDTVTVTTMEELADYADQDRPLVILIKGSLVASERGQLTLKSHKTLLGITRDAAIIGKGLSMSNAENIVIRYLTLRDNTLIGDYDGKANDYDALALRNTHHVWIDHCHLSRAGDGLLDMTLGSGYITASWTVFSFHNKTAASSGKNDSPSPLTLDHCWFNNTVQRNIAATDDQVHAFNCYFTGLRSYGMNARSGTEMLLENCFFRQCRNPYYAENGGQLQAFDCILEQCTGKMIQTAMTWRPTYDYDLDPVAEVPAAVVAGAGPNGYACLDTGPGLGINFQPAGQIAMYGYSPDEGRVFQYVEGKLSYGWSQNQADDSFWRQTISYKDNKTWVPVDADLRRNGGIGFGNGSRTWEMVVANGFYDLWIVCGDPGDPRDPNNASVNPPRLNHLMVEDTHLDDPDGIVLSDFDEYTLHLKVTDGKLTLSQANDGFNAAICFLEIKPAFDSVSDPFAAPSRSGRPAHR